MADAGYGSEENYALLEKAKIDAYIKFNYFDKDQRKIKNSLNSNLFYNSEKNCYYCPMGQPMNYIGSIKRVTENGFEQQISRYQAINCSTCPLRGACHKSKKNKIIEINHNLNRLKAQASERLKSEQGLYYRSKRGVDVEPVFANIKFNKGFKRFGLKGMLKTEIEMGLLALAHNLAKRAA